MAELQAEIAELAAANEQLGATIEDLRQQFEEIALAKASVEGKAGQLTLELTRTRLELGAERTARATAETALAGGAARRYELENRLAAVTEIVGQERTEAAGARERAERLAEQLVEGLKRLPLKARVR
jgi:chromosome segregation ATPase